MSLWDCCSAAAALEGSKPMDTSCSAGLQPSRMGCRQKCSFYQPHLLNSSLVWLWHNRGRCLQASAMPQLHTRRQI